MDRILIILKKENGPRASSAPALGLNTIIFKYVYWYMKQISGERLQDHWSSGYHAKFNSAKTFIIHMNIFKLYSFGFMLFLISFLFLFFFLNSTCSEMLKFQDFWTFKLHYENGLLALLIELKVLLICHRLVVDLWAVKICIHRIKHTKHLIT